MSGNRLPLKNRSRWPSSERQLLVNQWKNASSVSGERQRRITRIWICCSIDFVFHLFTRSGNLPEVNAIYAIIGCRHCATWKNSACSVGSQRHYAAELEEVDAHLSSSDSDRDGGAAHVNTPAPPLFVPLAAVPTSCEPDCFMIDSESWTVSKKVA